MHDPVPEVSVLGRQPEVKRVLGVGCTVNPGPPDLKSRSACPKFILDQFIRAP